MDLRWGAHLPLSPYFAFIISLCNGNFSTAQILDIVKSLEDIRQISKQDLINFLEESSINYLDLRNTPLPVPLDLPDPIKFARLCYKQFCDPWQTGIPYKQPVEIDLYLTENCNMRCRYCFTEVKNHSDNEELSADELSDLLEQAACLGVKRCTLTGGEPTLNNRIEELVKKSDNLGMYTVLATNATRLSAEGVLRLIYAGIKGIQISLDSFCVDTFDYMTQTRGLFPEVIKGIKEAVRSGIRITVKAVLTKYNIKEMANFIDECAHLGVAAVRLQNFEPGLHGRGDSTLFISEDEVRDLKDLVEAKSQSWGRQIKIMLVLTGRRWGEDEFRCCRHALSGFGVLSNGDVTICDRFGHDERMKIGNVRKEPLSRIWRSERHFEIVKPPINKVSQICASCQRFTQCRTGCFLYSLYSDGDIYAGDPRCPRVQPSLKNKGPVYADKLVRGGKYLFLSRN